MNDKKDLENLYSDFISTVSHELRTPLTSIKGFAQTLLGASDKLSEEQKIKFLNIIKEQADRLIKLIENMLCVSKIYSDNEVFVLTSVDLKVLIEKSIQIFTLQNQTRTINFSFNKMLPQCYCDSDKTQQVLINLIENALKYSKVDTPIDVVCDFSGEKNISIKIINYGNKIKKENYEKIFEKFYRIDNHLVSKTQGS